MKLKDIIIKNKYKLLTIIGVLLTFSIFIAVSYAFFGRVIENTNTNAISEINTSYYSLTTEGNTNISLTLNEDLLGVENANNTVPAFTSNGGNLNLNLTTLNSAKDIYCTYNIIYEPVNPLNSSNSSLNEFTISGISESGLSFSETNIVGSNPVTLISNALIKIDASSSLSTLDSWNFTVNFYNLNAMQDYIVGTNISGNIKLDNINCRFNNFNNSAEKIIAYNGGKKAIEAKGTPDFSVSETNKVGMYAAEDDLGTSYYFRGKVNNNWLKFGKYTSDMYYNSSDYTLYNACPDGGSCTKIASSGDDMYWRIIRINGDNSIRMIYTGVTPPTEATQYVMTESNYSTSIGKSAFNTNYDKSEYIGYMYTLGEQHGISTNSTIKTYLDNWYTFTNLSTYYTNNASADLIADQIYCNDRNTSSTWESQPSSTMLYAPYERLFSAGGPSLKCTTKGDRFTVNDTTNGNGALINPVGLITSDEILYAGANNQGNSNTSYYLYSGAFYWSGSPAASDIRYALGFFVGDAGFLGGDVVGGNIGVRGVVSLSSNAKLSGSGTYVDPYIVID